MRTPAAPTSMGGLLLLGLLAACLCGGGWATDGSRGRHIRRITAADLPPTPDNSSLPALEGVQPALADVLNKNTTKELGSENKPVVHEKQATGGSKDLHNGEANTGNNSTESLTLNKEPSSNITNQAEIDKGKDHTAIDDTEKSSSENDPKEIKTTHVATHVNITDTPRGSETTPKELIDAKIKETISAETSPKQSNSSEVLLTSSSTYRGRRPTGANNATTTTTEAPNVSQEVTEEPTKKPKEVNINEVVSSNRGSSRRLRKPVVVKKNGVVVANLTRTDKNCSDCEPAVESTAIAKPPAESNSSAEAASTNSKVNSVEATTKTKSQESTSVRPTVGAFNNIDFSSTARMVLQEKIHEDILHHLTTVSYAHYESDYVMDDNVDSYDAESQPSSNNGSSVLFGGYDGSDSSVSTPRVASFDEAYARISEGIQHNLDEIEEKSIQFEATSERDDDHFGSPSDTVALEGAPKNDSRVSLEFTNHVDILANRSAVGNRKKGDLIVENATHVDFEQSFVETKVIPEVSSTVRYLIDDVHSTTRVIPTKDSEEQSNNLQEDKDDDQSLESAEDDAVTARVEKPEDTNTSSSHNDNSTETETPDHANRTNLKLNASHSQILNKLRSQGRGRMFPSERIHANNSNNVDERRPEIIENKRLRARTSQESSNSSTVSPRSRSYLLRSTSPFPATRRVSVDATEPTSPRNSILLSRSSLYRQGASQDTQSSTSPRNNLIRSRVSHRYSPLANNTLRQAIPFTAEDAIVPTTTRSNLFRARPSNRYSPQLNDTRGQVVTHNDEGNDIPRNHTPAATHPRGGTKFTGVSPSSLTNEEYPIPPTAAAWSLVTMKEPGLRTSLPGIESRPSPTMQLVDNGDDDSHPSGSLNKQTTAYSKVTPTASLDAVTTTETLMTTPAGALPTTTEEETEVTTTQMPDFTTVKPSLEEESVTAPVEATSVKGDEEVRFDVGTTVPPAKTTQTSVKHKDVSEEVTTTTVNPETTKLPKEDDADALITTTETPGLLGFGFQDAVLPEDGSHDLTDTKEGEEEKEGDEEKEDKFSGHHGDEGKFNQQEEDGHLIQGEIDYGGPTGPDAGVELDSEMMTTTTPLTRSSLIVPTNSSKEVVEDMTTLRTDTQTVSINNVSATSIQDDVPEVTTSMDDLVTEVYDQEVTANSTADVPVMEDATTTTTATTEGVKETTPVTSPPDERVQPSTIVPSFLRVFVEATPRQFCETIGTFKKAVADLLTKGSGRIVSSDQVILRNFGREECSIPDSQDNSTSGGLLLPVELHLVDEAVNYDRQLNEAFSLIWGHEGLDFPLRILKVDVIAVPDDFMTSAVDNAGVIAAIAISCIGAVCLLLLAVLLIVMRKRQKKFNYGMRCTPVSLDAYSLDSVSIHDSVRRKAGLRSSKRSYGNPAFDDPSTPSHPLNFAGLTAFSTERGAIEDEFARIPHVTPKADELPPGSETKNRYANVLPLPETRVILSSQPHEQLADYINANYVTGPKNAANFYVACQAPLPSTITDFWRMVWEQQSKVIMMLTELFENGVEKCADYLPPSEVLDCHRLFGDFQVTLKKREVREKYVISTLQLKNLESNSWREVTHLWYVSWPTQGVPEEPNSMIAFLIEARSYMKNRSGPSVVHCSPGTGRTGTVLACDLSIREFEHTRQVDIPRCVARLRRDRAGCVQTRDQYAFIYQVLTLYATKLTGGALDSF